MAQPSKLQQYHPPIASRRIQMRRSQQAASPAPEDSITPTIESNDPDIQIVQSLISKQTSTGKKIGAHWPFLRRSDKQQRHQKWYPLSTTRARPRANQHRHFPCPDIHLHSQLPQVLPSQSHPSVAVVGPRTNSPVVGPHRLDPAQA